MSSRNSFRIAINFMTYVQSIYSTPWPPRKLRNSVTSTKGVLYWFKILLSNKKAQILKKPFKLFYAHQFPEA